MSRKEVGLASWNEQVDTICLLTRGVGFPLNACTHSLSLSLALSRYTAPTDDAPGQGFVNPGVRLEYDTVQLSTPFSKGLGGGGRGV
jgi:hypothetical protein